MFLLSPGKWGPLDWPPAEAHAWLRSVARLALRMELRHVQLPRVGSSTARLCAHWSAGAGPPPFRPYVASPRPRLLEYRLRLYAHGHMSGQLEAVRTACPPGSGAGGSPASLAPAAAVPALAGLLALAAAVSFGVSLVPRKRP